MNIWRDNYCLENDYDSKTKLSIIFSTLHWCPIGSYSSDDPQEKNLKLSLWAKMDKDRTVSAVNCEQ